MFFNNKKDNFDEEEDNTSPKKSNIESILSEHKKIIVIGLLIIILIISIILITNNKKEYYIDLVGEESITIYEGSEYIEDANSYYGYDSDGNDLTNEVEVTNNIDTSTIGEYTVTYNLNGTIKTRYINVIEKPKIATYIHLKGDEVIYLNINEEYIDPGYTAIDTFDSNLTKKVKTTNNIDSTKAGIYKVTYSVTNSSGVTSKAIRKVIVMDSEVSLTLTTTEYTNSEVGINIHIIDNYYSYLILPNGEKITNKDYTYKVSSNGEYKFTIYNTKGKSTIKNINVSNIDKENPTGTCSGYIKDGKSYITVSASDNFGISKYVSNGVNNEGNVITLSNEVTNPTVTIYDKAGNSININCTLEDKNEKTSSIEGIKYTKEQIEKMTEQEVKDMTKAEFIEFIGSAAVLVYQEYGGVLPSITIAQACYESGYGDHFIATTYNVYGLRGYPSSKPKVQGTGNYLRQFDNFYESTYYHTQYFFKYKESYTTFLKYCDKGDALSAAALLGPYCGNQATYAPTTQKIIQKFNLETYDELVGK